jgi:enterochelin esterase family protein
MTLLLILGLLLNGISETSFENFLESLQSQTAIKRNETVEEYLHNKKILPLIEKDSLVHFIWNGKADQVFLAGDLQGWAYQDSMNKINCGEKSLFYKSFTLPSDSRIDYRFIVDGVEVYDPGNPRRVPGLGPHSELVMPNFKFTNTTQYRDNIKHGRLDSLFFSSKNEQIEDRPIKIYLPSNYDTSDDLPLLFVNDGFEALVNSNYKNVLDNLIADRKIVPIVAVFIPPVDRDEEYVWAKNDIFISTLSQEILPLINERYKVTSRAMNRAIMGVSNGGHLALATGFVHPELFCKVAGQSSTLDPSLYQKLSEFKKSRAVCPEFKLYIDVGRYDLNTRWSYLETNREFHQKLLELQIPHVYQEFNDGHEWAGWRERTEQILLFFFGIE